MEYKNLFIFVLGIVVVFFAGTTGYLFLEQKNQLSLSSKTQELLPPPPPTPTTNTETKQKNCFNEGNLATNVDTQNWKLLYGEGFQLKYPAESVSITKNLTPNEYKNYHYTITSADGKNEARIKVFALQNEIYTARYMHTPSVAYEPYSDTWHFYEYGWDPSKFKQCSPNPLGKTRDEKYAIYSTSDGDAGSTVIRYFVVFRDIAPSIDPDISLDNYEPLIVEFQTGSYGEGEGYATFEKFQSLLENIIKTIELRPTSKG